MIAEFLLSNWKAVAICLLSAALSAMTHLYLGAEDGKRQIEIEFKLKIAAAEAATKEVQDRSTQTLEKIHADHAALLAQAQDNAVANYLRAHPRAVLVDAAACSCPGNATGLRLPNVPAASSGSGAANGAVAPDAGSGQCIPDAAFIRACAADSLQVIEFQRFVRGNHLPVEGE